MRPHLDKKTMNETTNDDLFDASVWKNEDEEEKHAMSRFGHVSHLNRRANAQVAIEIESMKKTNIANLWSASSWIEFAHTFVPNRENEVERVI